MLEGSFSEPSRDEPVGRAIRRMRGRTMTQSELAAAASVSLDLIRKLEQEVRYTASITSLHKIARALDVETSELLAKTSTLPKPSDDSGVVAIRRVLTSVGDLLGEHHDVLGEEGVASIRRTVDYAWGSYWAGRYEQLGEMLPNALLAVRAADPVPDVADLAAQLHQAAGCTLVHLGHPDAAHLALREGLRFAGLGSDPLRVAALRGSLSWLLLTQGRFAESEQLAAHTADSIEPGNREALPQMALYGSLLLSSATAAGRDGRSASAAGTLDEAAAVARHTGHRSDYESAFGPDQVTMQTVDVHVVTERYGAALKTARKMPRSTPLPQAAQARHMSDKALALTRLGQDSAAIDTLYTMKQYAPMWVRYQTQPRMTVQELRARERRGGNQRLRELARNLGVV